ncbi:MAG: hypothetical protein JWQ14_2344 [Adhaeribacter sp.]|nr:hypothetical protein [Adhaeribacter sp.]
MVFVFIVWVYIFCSSCSLGLILFNVTRKIFAWETTHPPVYMLSLVGLSILAGYLSIYNLFAPINIITHISLLLIILIYSFFHSSVYKVFFRQFWGYSKLYYTVWLVLGFIFILDLLYLNTLVVKNIDSRFYHIQSIKWMQSYPVIPGIGNLLTHIGFHSNFFLWSAFFSVADLFKQPVYALNSYLFLLLGGTAINMLLRETIQKNGKIVYSLFPVALFCLLLHFFSSWISSPTPDIAAMIFLALIFTNLLFYTVNPEKKDSGFNALAIMLFIFTAITIKLSVLPVAGILLYLIYFRQIKINKQWILLITGAFIFIMGPWFAHNVIQTGYLIFPFPAIDIFSFDWKIPLVIAIAEKNMIKAFAIEGEHDWQRILQIPFLQWFPTWFSYHSMVYKVIIIGAACSPFLMIFLGRRLRHKRLTDENYEKILALWLIQFLGFAFWLYSAPSLRFGLVFIYLSFFIPVFIMLEELLSNRKKGIAVGVLVILSGLGLNLLRDPIHFVRYQPDILKARFIYPENPPVPSLEKINLASISIWKPTKGFICWDAPIPCSYLVVKGLELRGPTITDGFRINKK